MQLTLLVNLLTQHKQLVETNAHKEIFRSGEHVFKSIAHDIVNFIAHLTGGFDWVIEMVQKALGVDNDTLDMGTKNCTLSCECESKSLM